MKSATKTPATEINRIHRAICSAGYRRDLASQLALNYAAVALLQPASVYPMPHWDVSATVTSRERGR